MPEWMRLMGRFDWSNDPLHPPPIRVLNTRSFMKGLIIESPPHVAWVVTGSAMAMLWANLAEAPTNGAFGFTVCRRTSLVVEQNHGALTIIHAGDLWTEGTEGWLRDAHFFTYCLLSQTFVCCCSGFDLITSSQKVFLPVSQLSFI